MNVKLSKKAAWLSPYLKDAAKVLSLRRLKRLKLYTATSEDTEFTLGRNYKYANGDRVITLATHYKRGRWIGRLV